MKMTMKHNGRSAEEIATLFGELTNAEILRVTKSGEFATVHYREVPNGYGSDSDGSECKMCGKEWSLNEEGYCSQCWVIWNS